MDLANQCFENITKGLIVEPSRISVPTLNMGAVQTFEQESSPQPFSTSTGGEASPDPFQVRINTLRQEVSEEKKRMSNILFTPRKSGMTLTFAEKMRE